MKKYEAHVFICSTCRYAPDPSKPEVKNPEGECQALRKDLKEKYKKLYPNDPVRISSSSCLGQCEQGIAAVIYPQAEWHLNLRPENIEETLFSACQRLLAKK